jgi:hypothetical protein
MNEAGILGCLIICSGFNLTRRELWKEVLAIFLEVFLLENF